MTNSKKFWKGSVSWGGASISVVHHRTNLNLALRKLKIIWDLESQGVDKRIRQSLCVNPIPITLRH